jgi:hypothetical protein
MAFAASTAHAAPAPVPLEKNNPANVSDGLSESGSQSAITTDADSAPVSLIPSAPALSATELSSVAQHVKSSLTRGLYDNFQLFLYVSKAASGRWAQRMFVLAKQPDGALEILYDWPVSTGRELNEFNAAGTMLPSFTPQGYYQLDPGRMYANHRSVQWGEQMPHAMFFNWTKEGHATGLAIHGATDGEVSLLGTRASAGCVRLAPDAAQILFKLVQTQYRGPVPMFEAYSRTGSSGNGGSLLVSPDGSFQVSDGYKVLVFIEDFGGDASVALLP